MTEEEKAAAAAAEAARIAAGGTPKPEEPFATFKDADAFNKRMDREARSRMKEMGIPDPTKALADLAELAKIREAQAAAELATKSEVERATAAKTAAEQRATLAEAKAEQMRLETHLVKVGAAAGVTNVDYMLFAVGQALDKLPEGEQLDEVAFIAEMAKDPAKAAALGIGGVGGGPAIVKQGVNTTGQGAGPEAKQQPAGGGQPEAKDAFAQPKGDFQAGLQQKYGFTPQH